MKHNCLKSVTAMAWKNTVFANDHIQFVVSDLNISPQLFEVTVSFFFVLNYSF